MLWNVQCCPFLERQLDELEFAPDSAPSQTPQRSQKQQQEEQQLQDEPQPDPVLTPMHQTPPPLLLPTSSFVPPFTSTCPLHNVQVDLPLEEPTKNDSEPEEDEEKTHHSRVPSILAAPLSPTMPLNSTYIARRTMPMVTQIPSTLLALSTLIPSTAHSIIQPENPSILAPVESVVNRTNQELIVPPVQCSVSTQTDNDLHRSQNNTNHHHHCSDVSECPCVRIYTRSEQLFMTSMAVFFRNSINVIAPPAQLIPPVRATRPNRRQQVNRRAAAVVQPTRIISEAAIPVPTEIDPRTTVRITSNE
jgi:hypothetical protein